MKLYTVSKIYIILALLAAAVFSPLAYSFAPVILLAWYLFQMRWPVSAGISLTTAYFLYFGISILYAQFIPVLFAPLVSLPVLLVLFGELEKIAPRCAFSHTRRQRWPGRLAVFIIVIDLAVLILSFAISNPALSLSSFILLAAVLALGVYIIRKFPLKPVSEEVETRRILAGKEEPFSAQLSVKTSIGGVLWLESESAWIKVNPEPLSLKGPSALVKGKISPSLSGSSTLKLTGFGLDRWGLTQTRFEIEPLKLQVIPRARYAVWLAQKYLSGTRPGALPLLSNLGSFKSTQGLRQGIEFYGSRQYQEGDSLKNIDWKHSVKYNELIVKEFTEFRGMPAIMLVNLIASNAEEADKLAYNIIIAAITLGQENIPTALAVYNQEKTVLNTSTLSATELLIKAMQLIKDIAIIPAPLKYLANPDIARLRANAARLSQSASQPAKVLAELMKREYQTISANAKLNPLSKALSIATSGLTAQSTVVVVSQRNHDAEALAFNSFLLSQKGISLISV
jgi:hypothetical protein